MLVAAVHLDRERTAVRVPQRGLERFRQALFDIGPHLQSIHHHLDGVLLGLGQLGELVDVVHCAVDAHPHEPLGTQVLEQVLLLALPPYDQRCQDHHPRVLGELHHVVYHLRHALGLQADVVIRAIRIPHACEQQAQVVLDLGDGADRGARIVARDFLLDRHRRRQAFDQVDVGLFHELQELARVGGQGFHIAALAFCVQRVECERRLARTGQTGDHDQAPARQINVDVLEVVRARAAHADEVHWNQSPTREYRLRRKST